MADSHAGARDFATYFTLSHGDTSLINKHALAILTDKTALGKVFVKFSSFRG